MQFSISVHTVWLFPEPYRPQMHTQNGESVLRNIGESSEIPSSPELGSRLSSVDIMSVEKLNVSDAFLGE